MEVCLGIRLLEEDSFIFILRNLRYVTSHDAAVVSMHSAQEVSLSLTGPG